LTDFIDYPRSRLSIRVLDPAGNPLTDGIVRLRDRMWEAWRPIAEGPTTLAYADHPIPYPPAAALRDGVAEFDSIRTGWLEFSVELDNGAIHRFTREVDDSRRLEVRLP
jgi:hypothetical protein